MSRGVSLCLLYLDVSSIAPLIARGGCLLSYDPITYYEGNAELTRVIDMIRDGFFSPDQKDR